MQSDKNYQIEHLQIVQDIIKRQAQNSFAVRGWSITLVTVIFAIIQTQNADRNSALLVLIPTAVFWYLDAWYLRQERIFRKLHDAIVQDIHDGTELIKPFEIAPKKYEHQATNLFRTMFSRTVLAVPLASITIAVLFRFVL